MTSEEKKRASRKRWKDANPEKWKASQRKYQTAHPEKSRGYRTRYMARASIASWARILVKGCKSTARSRGEQSEITEESIMLLWEKQQGLCFWLGIPMVPSAERFSPSKPSVDRIDCDKGYVLGNVVLSTAFANIGRRAYPADKFRTFIQQVSAKTC